MAETVATPKKVVKTVKKPKAAPTHPTTSVMVTTAIKTLKERGGSSLQAIKKYIAANYKVDVDRLAPFIKKFLRSAVTSGALIQTKGQGANGSFKLSAAKKAEKPVKKAKKPAAKKVKKAAKPAAKKTPKKAAKKPKAPKKEKKAKTPKKPKAPKPKKAVKKPAAKKAAPKKK